MVKEATLQALQVDTELNPAWNCQCQVSGGTLKTNSTNTYCVSPGSLGGIEPR